MLCTRLATPEVPLLVPYVPASVFDGFAHSPLVDLTWKRPQANDAAPLVRTTKSEKARAFDRHTRIDGKNPERMVFVMHAECTFLPKELAALHALGMGLTDEWALAPYGIDDATDAFFERRLAPRDYLWLAADNVNALVWGLHDWAHFHHHGTFEERALTELQCDVSALVWLHLNREAIGLDDVDMGRIVSEMGDITRERFSLENKPFEAPFFSLAKVAELSDKAARTSPRSQET